MPLVVHNAASTPSGSRPGTRGVRCLAAVLLALLAACGAPPPRDSRPPAEVHAQLVSMLPAKLADREGWASDVQAAFHHLELPPSTENLCAALAVIEQESTYTVDPTVPDLPRIARKEIDRRAAELHVPQVVVRAALALQSPDGRSYTARLARVRTERELSLLFEDFVGEVPLGRRLFADVNPVRTGGPMQVGIDFAERHVRQRSYPYDDASTRHAVFTRRGGLYFGIAHLLKYPNSYPRHLFRFADFNAGWYASRNAAFQAAVTAAGGGALALDGDLLLPDASFGRPRVGATEAALGVLAPQLELDRKAIRRDLERSDRHDFEETELYARVFALAERKTGRVLPRAAMPRIDLHSPKFTRRLTTEWFATRVQSRYQACVNRAFGR
jgi:hypothetical protein